MRFWVWSAAGEGKPAGTFQAHMLSHSLGAEGFIGLGVMKAVVGMLQIYCIKIQYSQQNTTSQVARPTMATRGFTKSIHPIPTKKGR